MTTESRPRATLTRASFWLLPLAATLAGCSDSALFGLSDVPPSQDTTEPSDVNDSDVPFVRCTSNDECGVIEASACEKPYCSIELGLCRLERVADCCITSGDCPAFDSPCLAGFCPFPGSTCNTIDTCSTCTDSTQCQAIAPPCSEGICNDGSCTFIPNSACCGTNSDCDDGDPCTIDTCGSNGQCTNDIDCDPATGQACEIAPECCAGPVVFKTDFSPSPRWEARSSDPAVRWQVLDTSLAASPPAALYLGNADTLTLASSEGDIRADVAIELGALPPGDTAEIRFRLLADLPANNGRAGLVAYLHTPGQRLPILENASTSNEWTWVVRDVPIPSEGPWRLVFEYTGPASVDQPVRGVFIDDIIVRVGCGSNGVCNNDRDCWLGDPCITSVCKEGQCLHFGNELCGEACRTNEQCEDGDPCTFGICLGDGTCVQEFMPMPGCEQTRCSSDFECDDGSRCTRDACLNGICSNESIPGCCRSEQDCADNDGCTIDACDFQTGLCNFVPNPICGGCDDFTCNDGDPCTLDLCADGQCLNLPDPSLPGCGGQECRRPEECNDGDFCTKDVCENGRCANYRDTSLPGCANTQCNGAFDCNDGNACTRDGCRDGRCFWERIPDCCLGDSQCSDNNNCTRDSCFNNRCRFEQIPGCGFCTDDACNDNDPCTVDRCSADGRCTNALDPNIPDCRCRVLTCNDNDPCTRDACENGLCVFRFDSNVPGCGQTCNSVTACDDGNPCTVDVCSASGLCVNTPILNGTACEDGSRCTNNDRCINGACAPGAAVTCNDNNSCTIDVCDPVAGCNFVPAPNRANCDDGNACTPNDVCLAGTCVAGSAKNCNDNNPCTIDVCDPVAGCTFVPAPNRTSCDDGNACTTNDVCLAGTCVAGSATNCNDNNPCTIDVCDPVAGCTFVPAPNRTNCDDGNACTTNDVCLAGTCVAGSAKNCNDNNPCTIDVCDPVAGCTFVPAPNRTNCDDGNACTTNDVCLAGTCVAGSVRDCNDNNPCTLDSCSNGTCVNVIDSSQSGCSTGCTATSCNDNDRCTGDRCNAATGRCEYEPLFIAGCVYQCETDCNDNNPCTADRCDTTRGICRNEAIAGCCRSAVECVDGDICTEDACTNNRCQNTPTSGTNCGPPPCASNRDCEDGNICTSDLCDAATGKCSNTPTDDCCNNDGDCGDGDACTLDVCVTRFNVCVNPIAPCNDNNDCTLDSCDPTVGCVFRPDPACGSTCTEAVLWKRSFDVNETADITIEGNQSVRWRVDAIRASSAPNALRYGKEDGSDYSTGSRTVGRATGPELDIPADRNVTLNFRVWLDIDALPAFDFVAIRAIAGDTSRIIWSRDQIATSSYRSWVPVTVTIPQIFAGQTTQFRFVFDSIDGTGNAGQGVFFDDIVVKATCP